MHGGLFSEDNVTLDDIRKVDRNRQPPETGTNFIVQHCHDSIHMNTLYFELYLPGIKI